MRDHFVEIEGRVIHALSDDTGSSITRGATNSVNFHHNCDISVRHSTESAPRAYFR